MSSNLEAGLWPPSFEEYNITIFLGLEIIFLLDTKVNITKKVNHVICTGILALQESVYS